MKRNIGVFSYILCVYFYTVCILVRRTDGGCNVVFIIGMSNFINTASGIVTVSQGPSGAPDGH